MLTEDTFQQRCFRLIELSIEADETIPVGSEILRSIHKALDHASWSLVCLAAYPENEDMCAHNVIAWAETVKIAETLLKEYTND